MNRRSFSNSVLAFFGFPRPITLEPPKKEDKMIPGTMWIDKGSIYFVDEQGNKRSIKGER